MNHVLASAQVAVAVVVLAHGTWWTLLSIAALPGARRHFGPNRSPLSVTIVVPAHNEARLIGETVASLRAASLNYPADILVVAVI